MLMFLIFLVKYNFHPKNIYEEQTKIFGIAFLVLVILYCIYYLLNLKTIYVYKDFLEIKNFFSSKNYYYTDFKTYYSENIDGKYNSWKQYFLILKTGERLKFSDKEFENFHIFFPHILNKINIDKKYNKEITNSNFLKYAIISIIISFLIFYFSIPYYNFKKIDDKEYSYISGVLSSEFILEKQSRSTDYYNFHLQKYPDYTFRIFNVKSLDDYNLLENIKNGDSIEIGIEKVEYEKKISKTKPLNFLDKYLKYNLIIVKQIIDSKKMKYIDLEIENKSNRENNYIGIGMFSFFGLFFLVMAIGNYNAYKNNKSWL